MLHVETFIVLCGLNQGSGSRKTLPILPAAMRQRPFLLRRLPLQQTSATGWLLRSFLALSSSVSVV